MNENIDLVKILKDVPEGTKLYSPMLGYVTFKGIDDDEEFPINVLYEKNIYSFSKDGKYYARTESECLLFPTKEQRNWSKFKHDLPIDTPCMVCDNNFKFWFLRFYAGDNNVFPDGYKSSECIKEKRGSWNHIVPVSKFNFEDMTFDKKDDYGMR